MKESFKIVSTAIPGGIITGFSWIFVNRFVPQAGAGFLERQSWPLNNIYLCVAIWKTKKRVKPGELAEQLNEVVELHRLIVNRTPDYSNTRLEIRGSAKMEIDTSVMEFAPLAIGGCAGMFLAFVLFLPVFFLFAEKIPWIVFVWPIFGMGVMAASAFAASRLARRWKS